MTEEKIAQLEQIEKELNIDLLIALKAIKNGFYLYRRNNEPEFVKKDGAAICKNGISVAISLGYGEYHFNFFTFEDYGQEWALTKEELMK